MRKRIDIQDVRKGMYIAELDRPWIETPFLFQGFELSADEELAQLQQLCQYVYIDTEQGLDISPEAHARSSNEPIQLEARRQRLLEDEIRRKVEARNLRSSPAYADQTSLEQELKVAKSAERHTRQTVYDIMNDVRLGKSVDTRAAKRAVSGMVASIIRNPDAMVCLSQLKDKDEYTALHSLRVCILALAFGRHLGFSEEELNLLGLGALLHDIGKMRIPPEILNKPGGLTEAEFDIIKSHVPLGVEILEKTQGIPNLAIDVARYHHERYDGSGYATGLTGDAISQFGLIGSIVDCYDAITSDRSYHKGMSAHDALKKMYEWRTKDFDPDLVEQFIQCMGIYPIGSLVEMNTGSIGVVATINRRRRLRPKVVLVLTPDKIPYQEPKVVNLYENEAADISELEIKKVIAAGSHGINPVDYLPV